jgi:hypothetical protein
MLIIGSRFDTVRHIPILLHRHTQNTAGFKRNKLHPIRVLLHSCTHCSAGISVFLGAAWNSILRTLSIKITYRRAYLYYWVGYFSDLVIPCATIWGELTRFYLVQKETKKATESSQLQP